MFFWYSPLAYKRKGKQNISKPVNKFLVSKETVSKPVARHFNLPNHSHHNMTICGLSFHQGNTESRKTLEQKLIFQLGTLSPHGINERFSFH